MPNESVLEPGEEGCKALVLISRRCRVEDHTESGERSASVQNSSLLVTDPKASRWLVDSISVWIIHMRVLWKVKLMPAKCLAHPQQVFYCSCVFDVLPCHLRSLTSSIEAYLVPTAEIHSAVDSAVAIWQAVGGSTGEWGGFYVGINSICFWERSSPCPLACVLLINSPRNGNAAEIHYHYLFRAGTTAPLGLTCSCWHVMAFPLSLYRLHLSSFLEEDILLLKSLPKRCKFYLKRFRWCNVPLLKPSVIAVGRENGLPNIFMSNPWNKRLCYPKWLWGLSEIIKVRDCQPMI